MATDYRMTCIHCGTVLDSDTRMLAHHDCSGQSFLRADYSAKQLSIDESDHSLYRFADWLPIRRRLAESSAPVSYQSEGLAGHLGLKNLTITYSGYWPQKGALMKTGSFKECEAYSVCASLPEDSQDVLVVASAGNTARAFSRVCSTNKIPLIVCIPEPNMNAMWFDHELDDCVKIIAAGGDSDYYDAIYLAEQICKLDGFYPEGGAKNIARRDGMGTTVLSAATHSGRIPDYYFQAVGSGTGAIAAWEANLRLIDDGRFGDHKMQLFTSQNEPFVLLQNSWHSNSRKLAHIDDDLAREQIAEIWAPVLSNRKPPYGIEGGFFDALSDAGGDVLSASNAEAHEAYDLFLELEGSDIDPAAAVATATMIKAVKAGEVDKNSHIMLNITGGGAERAKRERPVIQAEPTLVVDRENTSLDLLGKSIPSLF